ncbi:MAG: hypothetical protein SVW57_05485 [Thermodesulfobacteriota bacterium]|nr:hypothetical protein [Thermodesulfobacteriota bacterium]
MEKEKLSHTVLDYVISEGACSAGIVTLETLRGGPSSADLSYVLPSAKSAISFAFALDQKMIPPFFDEEGLLLS